MASIKFDRAQVEKLMAALPDDKSEVVIVKDDGIYLMSFAEKPTAALPGAVTRTIVYGKGFDPKKDEDVWDKCRDAVGGDDFGEPVGTKADFVATLADSVGDLTVKVTSKTISLGYTPKPKGVLN